MPPPRALVIGAGIGGLTAAVALQRRGWDVTVLERHSTLEPVGAGISVFPNAQRALDVIGLGDEIRALRAWHDAGGLRTPSGRWLARTTNDAAVRRFGGPVVLLHRATFVGLLRDRLGDADRLRTGVTATLEDPGSADAPAVVLERSADGTEHRREAELVVAADGIHSAVRRALFPGHPGPRYAGFTTWRVVVDALERPFEPHESWGRGAMWGSQPLPDGRVYAYGGAVLPAGLRAPDDERSELLRRFGSWHHPVPAILAAAEPGQVLRNDVYQMADPLPAHHHGRVALLGDAAHAMTPGIGQGGNQAVEDAIVLAHHAEPGAAPGTALAAYTRDRLPRTTEVVRRAARASRISTRTGVPACALRNAVIATVSRLAPRASLRALDGVADWNPPTASYAADSRGTRRGQQPEPHAERGQ